MFDIFNVLMSELSAANLGLQPVKEEDRNGIVTSYSAVVSVDGEFQTSSYTLPENLFVFIITAPCNRGITAALYAYTSVGRSPAAVLSLPALNVGKWPG